VQQVNIDPSEPTLQPGIAERAIDTAIDVSHNHEPFRKPARRGRSPQRPARLNISRLGWNQSPPSGLLWQQLFRSNAMKPLLISTAILGILLAPAAAEAKGCIKGAIVGGIAGHMAGHGKVGAAAGCVIGHHEASKPDTNPGDQRAPASQDKHI
jgi:hypothetical protein